MLTIRRSLNIYLHLVFCTPGVSPKTDRNTVTSNGASLNKKKIIKRKAGMVDISFPQSYNLLQEVPSRAKGPCESSGNAMVKFLQNHKFRPLASAITDGQPPQQPGTTSGQPLFSSTVISPVWA